MKRRFWIIKNGVLYYEGSRFIAKLGTRVVSSGHSTSKLLTPESVSWSFWWQGCLKLETTKEVMFKGQQAPAPADQENEPVGYARV